MANLLNHEDYTIAWIAVLPIEANAALRVLDKQHKGHFPTSRGDDYLYLGGELNGHNVVVATLPEGQTYGVGAAAALASHLKSRFTNIWFALLVGVAAGLPNLTCDDVSRIRDIRLGDVLVCVPDKDSGGVIHYDLGRDTNDGFQIHGRQAEMSTIVRSAIGRIRLGNRSVFEKNNELAKVLSSIVDHDADITFRRPLQETGQLVELNSASIPTHQLVQRHVRDDKEATRVWYGRLGSGNSLMRNAHRRDYLRDKYDVIGLEMEAAGVINVLPTGIVRGLSISPSDAKRIVIPFRRDPDFVDRPDILDQVDAICSAPAGRAALLGLGGVGKSQLAIEYAYRVHGLFPQRWVFWVHAGTNMRWQQDYRAIADRLQLPGRDEPGADVPNLVSQWLMFDDQLMLQASTLPASLPQSHHGSILVTSRSREAALTLVGRTRDILKVERMEKDLALSLLETKLEEWPTNDAGLSHVSELVQTLEYLPLAISQAAAYINRLIGHDRIEKYIARFHDNEQSRLNLFKNNVPDLRRDKSASNSVLSTWQVSFEQIRASQPSAAHLLSLMACCDRQGIPKSMLIASLALACRASQATIVKMADDNKFDDGPQSKPTSLGALIEIYDERLFENDTAILNDCCMIWMSDGGDTLQLHALVQLATRKWLEEHHELERWKDIMIVGLMECFPEPAYEKWAVCQSLTPHVEMAEQQHWQNRASKLALATVLQRTGTYMTGKGVYVSAKRFLERSVTIQRDILGLRHRDTLLTTSDLGRAYNDLGQHDDAEAILRTAMTESSVSLGNEHSITLAIIAKLGWTLYCTWQLLEAEKLLNRVCVSNLNRLGISHPDTLEAMSKVASVSRRRGNFESAKKLQRHLVKSYRQTLGNEALGTMHGIHDLAHTLMDLQETKEATALLEEVFRSRSRVLGQQHPLTLGTLCSLARSLCYSRIDHARCEALLRQAISCQRETLGSEHEDTSTTLSCLGMCLRVQHRYDEALFVLHEVLEMDCRRYGEYEAHTLVAMEQLAGTYHNSGELNQAEHWYRRVLLLCPARSSERRLPHNFIPHNIYSLAFTLTSKGQYDEAEQLYRQAYAEYVKVNGEDYVWAKHCLSEIDYIHEQKHRQAAAKTRESTDRRSMEHIQPPDVDKDKMYRLANPSADFQDAGTILQEQFHLTRAI